MDRGDGNGSGAGKFVTNLLLMREFVVLLFEEASRWNWRENVCGRTLSGGKIANMPEPGIIIFLI